MRCISQRNYDRTGMRTHTNQHKKYAKIKFVFSGTKQSRNDLDDHSHLKRYLRMFKARKFFRKLLISMTNGPIGITFGGFCANSLSIWEDTCEICFMGNP